jgi:hypothetical protein
VKIKVKNTFDNRVKIRFRVRIGFRVLVSRMNGSTIEKLKLALRSDGIEVLLLGLGLGLGLGFILG